MHKFSLPDSPFVEHAYPDLFQVQRGRAYSRLLIGPRGGTTVQLALDLVAPWGDPLRLLVVHLVPRSGAFPAGRYQSPPLSHEIARQVLESHRQVIEQDARCNYWIASPA